MQQSLTALTLNMAHGRLKSRWSFVDLRQTLNNLNQIADLISREKPEVVALQEADTRSVFSGGFDHIRYISKRARLPHALIGDHVNNRYMEYGTALISHLPLLHNHSHRFRPTRPFPAKGYVVGVLPVGSLLIDVVSLHLCFLKRKARRAQVDHLIQLLRSRSRPKIVMGDFNSPWNAKDSAVRQIAQSLDLKTYQPENNGLVTYPLLSKRLDWVLASPELPITDFRILPDPVSDHQAVLVKLELCATASQKQSRHSAELA